MKATDFRLGNLVMVDGEVRTVLSLESNPDLVNVNVERTGWVRVTIPKHCEGIPLTEEWLLKFGFQPMTCILFNWETEYIMSPKKLPWSIGVLLGDYPEDNPNCGVVSILQPNDEAVGSIPDDLYDKEEWTDEDRERVLNYKVTVPKWRQPIAFYFKYVHQLQNLYWCLCGEELDIKL